MLLGSASVRHRFLLLFLSCSVLFGARFHVSLRLQGDAASAESNNLAKPVHESVQSTLGKKPNVSVQSWEDTKKLLVDV